MQIELLAVCAIVSIVLLLSQPGSSVFAKVKIAAARAEPQGFWTYTSPYTWEYPVVDGRPHVLGVGSGQQGYGQTYNGPGGFNDTCPSRHGCIDQWSWWQIHPQSKLGIPSAWFWDITKPARREGSNYKAWNYLN